MRNLLRSSVPGASLAIRLAQPVPLAALLIFALAIYYALKLSTGQLGHSDEYLSLDRAYSFLTRHDLLTVYSENRPTFKKPPLQYWMDAWLMWKTSDVVFAMRLPSYVFALATLVATGALAYVLQPSKPYVVPAAIALLAGSTRFWESAMSAMLDSGAALFSTVAIAACLLALRQPRWWHVVALATGLAAWQKAPIPLALVAGILLVVFATRRLHDVDLGHSLRNRHFAAAFLLMLAGVLSWPAIQWVRHGTESFEQAYLDQMIARFSPLGTGGSARHNSWFSVLVSGEGMPRIPAIIAVFALPWVIKRLELLALPALLTCFILATGFASGYVSPRYSLIFLPLMMAALAAVLLQVISRPLPAIAAVAVLSLSSLGPFKSAQTLGMLDDSQMRYEPFLRNIAASLASDETLLVCKAASGEGKIYRGVISFYASAGRPFERIGSPDELVGLEREGKVKPPYRGLCEARKFDELNRLRPDYRVVDHFGGFIHWSGSAAQ